MMNDLTWNEFCELYFDTAKHYAGIHLKHWKDKQGDVDRRVDEEYVIDCAVLTALEKTYTHFDSSRGAKITTYLSTLVHNELVDTLKKEQNAAKTQSDIEDVKKYIRSLEDDGESTALSDEAKARLIPLLTAAVERLSPSDQVILNYYLEDKSTYIDRSTEALHVRRNYVSLRCHRIMKLLPKLMGMTREEYQAICLDSYNIVFANNNESPSFSKLEEPTGKRLQSRRARPCFAGGSRRIINPILPTINIDSIVDMLLA